MEATRSRHGWVHMFITHRPTVTLQLRNFDLFRTCRTSSFWTLAWQLAKFQLTRRIARSLGDSWASCYVRKLGVARSLRPTVLFGCSAQKRHKHSPCARQLIARKVYRCDCLCRTSCPVAAYASTQSMHYWQRHVVLLSQTEMCDVRTAGLGSALPRFQDQRIHCRCRSWQIWQSKILVYSFANAVLWFLTKNRLLYTHVSVSRKLYAVSPNATLALKK